MHYCLNMESSSPSRFINLRTKNNPVVAAIVKLFIFSPTDLNNVNFLILTLVKLWRNQCFNLCYRIQTYILINKFGMLQIRN